MYTSPVVGLCLMCIINSPLAAQQSTFYCNETYHILKNNDVSSNVEQSASQKNPSNISHQRIDHYMDLWYFIIQLPTDYVYKQLSVVNNDLILYLLLICVVLSINLQRNDIQHSMTVLPAELNMVTTTTANRLCYVDRKNHVIPYDTILQLSTVMAIICTEEGNRNRRLGDLHAAKRYYQISIRIHQYMRQTLINVHNA